MVSHKFTNTFFTLAWYFVLSIEFRTCHDDLRTGPIPPKFQAVSTNREVTWNSVGTNLQIRFKSECLRSDLSPASSWSWQKRKWRLKEIIRISFETISTSRLATNLNKTRPNRGKRKKKKNFARGIPYGTRVWNEARWSVTSLESRLRWISKPDRVEPWG